MDPVAARYLPPRGETPLLSSYDPPPNRLQSAFKGTRPRTAYSASRRVQTPDPVLAHGQQLQHDEASLRRSRSPLSSRSLSGEVRRSTSPGGSSVKGAPPRTRVARQGGQGEASRAEEEARRAGDRAKQLHVLRDIALQRQQELEMALGKSELLDRLLEREVDHMWPIEMLAKGAAGSLMASLQAPPPVVLRCHTLDASGMWDGGDSAKAPQRKMFDVFKRRASEILREIAAANQFARAGTTFSKGEPTGVGRAPEVHTGEGDRYAMATPEFDRPPQAPRGGGMTPVHVHGYNGTCGNLRFQSPQPQDHLNPRPQAPNPKS